MIKMGTLRLGANPVLGFDLHLYNDYKFVLPKFQKNNPVRRRWLQIELIVFRKSIWVAICIGKAKDAVKKL